MRGSIRLYRDGRTSHLEGPGDDRGRQAYRAIWERVEIHAILQPYDLSQTKAYIHSQLDYSGFRGSIFSDDSQKLIFEYTSGVPRLINNVCRNALIFACQNRRTIIDDRMVQQVIDGET